VGESKQKHQGVNSWPTCREISQLYAAFFASVFTAYHTIAAHTRKLLLEKSEVQIFEYRCVLVRSKLLFTFFCFQRMSHPNRTPSSSSSLPSLIGNRRVPVSFTSHSSHRSGWDLGPTLDCVLRSLKLEIGETLWWLWQCCTGQE
jgi:hypothetical protein